MKKRKCVYSYLFFFLTGLMSAQHYQFSQFYAAPLYLNPAFAGANVCSRFSLNYRNQWSGIPGTYSSFQASMDHSLKKLKSGIGISLYNDVAGLGSLRTTQINFLYAYETKISKSLMGRAGISAGSIQRKVNYSALTFGDEISRGTTGTVEGFPGEGITYFDLSSGILLYTKNAWGGLAGYHLNKPNQSFMSGTSPLPREIRLHGGYKYSIAEHESSNKKDGNVDEITFAFNFKAQNKFRQLDLGFYYTKSMFVIGAWYRGIPLHKPTGSYRNNDALIVIVGMTAQKFKIGYSYDYTISKLSNANSKGSHEISMAYQLCNSHKEKKKKNTLISCPKF